MIVDFFGEQKVEQSESDLAQIAILRKATLKKRVAKDRCLGPEDCVKEQLSTSRRTAGAAYRLLSLAKSHAANALGNTR